MFGMIRYRRRINKLSKQQNKIQKEYRTKINKETDRERIRELEAYEFHEFSELQEEIDLLMTSNLRNKASKLFIPLPKYEDEEKWQDCRYISTQKTLTTAGINDVRTAIRLETKGRIEMYLPWIVAVSGLIGVGTGFVAMLKK